jgi:hypothetical protein
MISLHNCSMIQHKVRKYNFWSCSGYYWVSYEGMFVRAKCFEIESLQNPLLRSSTVQCSCISVHTKLIEHHYSFETFQVYLLKIIHHYLVPILCLRVRLGLYLFHMLRVVCQRGRNSYTYLL